MNIGAFVVVDLSFKLELNKPKPSDAVLMLLAEQSMINLEVG